MITISIEEYQDHRENYDGLCLACREFTCGGVEPDAEEYECEACGESKVVGAEIALMSGAINVV
jgi:hypothetical protein